MEELRVKRKLLTILFCSFLILGMVTGCGEQQVEDTPKEKTEEKSKGKCEVEECINKIETNMTLEEVNDLIGFDGEKKDDEDTYVWQLTEKTKITVEFKDKKKASIKATYDKEKISDSKLKLSICSEIIKDIKKKTYTYEEMVEKLEGVEGHLENKSSTSKMYVWAKDGQTFRATFSDSAKGKATIVSMR